MMTMPTGLRVLAKVEPVPRVRSGETDVAVAELSDPLADLVVQAQQGDDAAFEQLLRKTETQVYNICFSVLHNVQEAEDATQSVYLRVWRALPDFRLEAKFSTWLYRIAVNTCLNRQRALRSQLQTVDGEDVLLAQSAQTLGPAMVTEQNDSRRALWAEVDRLSPKYRLVINLFYQQQMSCREISEVLAVPIGTIKAHLNRARHALAQTLTDRQEANHEETT